MEFSYSAKLPALLNQIEDFLVSNTPGAIAKLKIAEPVYAVFLWYDDSSIAGDFAPDFGVGTESMQSTCARSYTEQESVNDCRWRPQQVIPELVPNGKFEDHKFVAACNESYALMLAANQTGLPLGDESGLLRPFRSMMHRVATLLNEKQWESYIDCMEEFVVVSADRIGYWLEEDFRSSIPEAKWKLIQRQGLFNAE